MHDYKLNSPMKTKQTTGFIAVSLLHCYLLQLHTEEKNVANSG